MEDAGAPSTSRDAPSASKGKRRASYGKRRTKKKVPKACNEDAEGVSDLEEEVPGTWSTSEPTNVVKNPKTWDPQYSAKSPRKPADAFALYFDDPVMHVLVEETNHYVERTCRKSGKN